jgi:predicted ATP-grasp superfamily ATP-dependent carboligase
MSERRDVLKDAECSGSKPKSHGDFGAVVLGGHAQGLGIIRSLGRKGVTVYLIDETAANISRFSKYCRRFFLVPKMKQEQPLLNFLIALSKNEGIEGWVVFPTHDATVEILSKNRAALSDCYRISVPPWSAAKLAHNKILTYRMARKTGIPVPHTYFPENIDELRRIGRDIEYPVIIKPAVMHTFYAKLKTKAFKVSNLEELERMYQKACTVIDPSEIMVQEIIPGSARDLYSCGCFYKQGVLIASCIGQRCRQIPMDFGKATTFVQSADLPELRQYSDDLLKAIGYYGLAEVEFMQDPRDGIFKLLEINPRSWKWHTFAIKSGIDMPYLIYSDLVGQGIDRHMTARLDVKWVEIISDLYVAFGEIAKGNLSVRDYLDSLKGDLEFAIASRDDPLPFIGYVFLIPYLMFSR